MNDFVTLYQPPDQPGGTLFVEVPHARLCALIYCPAGTERVSADLEDRQFEGIDEFKHWRSKALSRLRQEGGWMIEFNDREYILRPFQAHSYCPPRNLWIASLGSAAPQSMPMQVHAPQRRGTSDRLIVPVNETAEGELECWMEQLKGFPEDLRAMVFHSLCRPGLEFRVRRLERDRQKASPVAQPPLQQPSAEGGVSYDRRAISGALFSSVCSALLSLALLLVFLGAGPSYSSDPAQASGPGAPQRNEKKDDQQPLQPPAGPAGQTRNESGAGAGPEEAGGEGASDAADEKIESSFQALMSAWKQAEPESAPGRLYRSHVAKQPGGKFSNKELNPQGWAIAKLHAVCDGHALTEETLTEADFRSPLKDSLKKKPLSPGLQDTFAYFGCRLLGVAGLPSVEEDETKAEYLVGQCGRHDPEKILEAIQRLTECVKNPPQPGGLQ